MHPLGHLDASSLLQHRRIAPLDVPSLLGRPRQIARSPAESDWSQQQQRSGLATLASAVERLGRQEEGQSQELSVLAILSQPDIAAMPSLGETPGFVSPMPAVHGKGFYEFYHNRNFPRDALKPEVPAQ